MNEEVSQKTIMLIVNSSRMTGRVLAGAMRTWLYQTRRGNSWLQRRGPFKQPEGEMKAAGRKSLKEMMQSGEELVNIRITDKNIKSFEKVARKYNIAYSLKRDRSGESPRYYVFFRAKDTGVMEAAFREYAGVSLIKEKKASVTKKLERAAQKAASREKQQNRQRTRSKERERERER